MATNWPSWGGLLGNAPTTNPYVAGIPTSFKQGDTPTWSDVPFVDGNGVEYDSTGYVLKYALAGPIAAPLVLTATQNGNSWQTTIAAQDSVNLTPGLYWWQAQLFVTAFQLTIAEGELTVEQNFALAGANFDNRTLAEKALSDSEAALAMFRASGGRLQAYTIGTTHIAFQSDRELLDVIAYWKKKVAIERSKARKGRDRHIMARFDRAN